MKIKKMSFYVWTLIAAMVISVLPINAKSVKAAETKVLFAYDAETATETPEQLKSAFGAPAAQWEKANALRFTEKESKAVISLETVSSGKVTFDFEVAPASKTAQSFVVKNSAGEALVIIGNNIAADATGTIFVADKIAAALDDAKAVADLGTFNKNTWLKVSVEIDLAAASYKATVKQYAEMLKYSEDAAAWAVIGETTQKISAGKLDVASVEMYSTVNNRWIGDVSITAEAGEAAKTETPKTEEPKAETTKPAQEAQPAQTTSNGNTYTVQKGDTLCAIARKLFNAEAKWADIYNWNKATIKDASLIYIGQVLNINGEAAKPAEETKPSQPTQTTAAEVKNLAVKAEGYHDFATNTRMLKANLTWAAADGVTSYDVYRGAEKVATVNTTSYEDTTAMTDTSVEYAVAAAGAANKTTAKVTSIGYDVTLLQVQKDLDKVEHTPTTAPGYLPVIAQGKKDENLATVYGKDGNKYGFNSETQVGRYRMAEVVAVNWPENDIRAGEALTSKDAPIVFTTEVPNGTYNVYVICCDLDHLYDGAPKHKAVQNISVTGGETVAAEVAENGGYIETKLTAEVTDRKLVVTVSGMEGKEGNGRLNGIIVTSTAK